MEGGAAVCEELAQIRLVLEELLGRPSRWSGVLGLTDDPAVHGAKPFRCDILHNAALGGQDVRWRTLIHEMLHTFSAGYHRRNYDQFPGWEEGAVEQTQRLLRPAILARLGVTVEEVVFAQPDCPPSPLNIEKFRHIDHLPSGECKGGGRRSCRRTSTTTDCARSRQCRCRGG